MELKRLTALGPYIIFFIGLLAQALCIAIITVQKPLVGGVIPPYGIYNLPPSSLWGMTGWVFDAFMFGVGGLICTSVAGMALIENHRAEMKKMQATKLQEEK